MPGWSPVPFEDLEGWERDDHLAALACFRISARAMLDEVWPSRNGIAVPPGLKEIAREALELTPGNLTGREARNFFETWFEPRGLRGKTGFVTAYFEPEVPASRVRTPDYPYPLYRKPADLVKVTDENRPENWPEDLENARMSDGGLVAYYDRAEINKGALAGRGLELYWLRSEIEGFYIHVQGSARLVFDDGSSARVSYAGKTGHPYTSIGKVLVGRGVMTVEQANMETIRNWLEEDEKRASELLGHNRSFIFFAEVENHDPDFGPRAAAGVQLTPGRSLAVDRNIHPYGTPVWLSTEKPLPHDTRPYQRLMIAQDTGSAIVGPQRGDIFIGSGREAGMVAGSVRHDTQFVVLSPREDG